MSFERWRNKRVARKLSQQSERIRVRDVVVTQQAKTFGEFNFSLRMEREATASLLDRMTSHIVNMANVGLEIHLADNFQNPQQYQNQHLLRENIDAKMVPVTEEMIKSNIDKVDINELDLREAELKLRRQLAVNMKIKGKEIRLEAAKQYFKDKRDNLIEEMIDDLQSTKKLSRWLLRKEVAAKVPIVSGERIQEEAEMGSFTPIELKKAENSLRLQKAATAPVDPEQIRATAKHDKTARLLQAARQKAKEGHVKTLNTNQAVMKPDCVNHITRVILNEFSFYPYHDFGPLSEEMFSELILKIENLAKNYPENLHLVLASFPVSNAQNQVYNTVLYVQCGPEPKIYPHTKSNPASVDPEYLGTRLPYLGSGSSGRRLEEIIKLHRKYIKRGLHQNPVIIDMKQIDDLVRIWRSNPDYAYDKGGIPKKEIEELEKIVLRLKNATTFEAKTELAEELLFKLKSLELEIRKRSLIFEAHGSGAIALNPALVASLPAASGQGHVYAAQIPITTAGGVRASVFLEVCLEHCQQVAVKKLHASLTEKIKNKTRIDKSVSQIIVANTVAPKEKNMIAAYYTQADPRISDALGLYTAKPETAYAKASKAKTLITEENIKQHVLTTFGSPVTIRTYPPYTMSELSHELVTELDEYNKTVEKIEAIKLYYASLTPAADEKNAKVDTKEKTAYQKEEESKINAVLLAYYVTTGDIANLDAILTTSVNVNAKDEYGNTPLHIALNEKFSIPFADRVEIIQKLLMAGASLVIPNNENHTPLDIAQMYYPKEMAEFLTARGIVMRSQAPENTNAFFSRRLAIQHVPSSTKKSTP